MLWRADRLAQHPIKDSPNRRRHRHTAADPETTVAAITTGTDNSHIVRRAVRLNPIRLPIPFAE
jgi:hypothetical protein